MDGKHEATKRTINNLVTKKNRANAGRVPLESSAAETQCRIPLQRPSGETHCRDPLQRTTAETHRRDPLKRPTAGVHCRDQLQRPTGESHCTCADPLQRPTAQTHWKVALHRPTAQTHCRDQIWIFLSWYLQLRGPQKWSAVRRFMSCEVKLGSWLLDVRPCPPVSTAPQQSPMLCVWAPFAVLKCVEDERGVLAYARSLALTQILCVWSWNMRLSILILFF